MASPGVWGEAPDRRTTRPPSPWEVSGSPHRALVASRPPPASPQRRHGDPHRGMAACVRGRQRGNGTKRPPKRMVRPRSVGYMWYLSFETPPSAPPPTHTNNCVPTKQKVEVDTASHYTGGRRGINRHFSGDAPWAWLASPEASGSTSGNAYRSASSWAKVSKQVCSYSQSDAIA